jgi:hypothetical protein
LSALKHDDRRNHKAHQDTFSYQVQNGERKQANTMPSKRMKGDGGRTLSPHTLLPTSRLMMVWQASSLSSLIVDINLEKGKLNSYHGGCLSVSLFFREFNDSTHDLHFHEAGNPNTTTALRQPPCHGNDLFSLCLHCYPFRLFFPTLWLERNLFRNPF